MPEQTRPCEYCGTAVTRTGTQQSQRKYWTCGRVCANKLRIKIGNTPTWQSNRFRGQRETRPCANCGKPVTRYVTEQNHDRPWSCSYECGAKVKFARRMADGTWTQGKKPRKGDRVPCSICGTQFYRQPAYIEQGRHLCSRACNQAWQSRNRKQKECRYCGAPFSVAPSATVRQFCSKSCEGMSKIVRPTGRIHNGRPVVKNAQGYLTVYEPAHPSAHKHNGRVLEHRLVVEKTLGRYLTPKESVNHINHVRDDNRPENLEVLTPNDHSRETAEWTRKKRAALDAELAELRARVAALEDEKAKLP